MRVFLGLLVLVMALAGCAQAPAATTTGGNAPAAAPTAPAAATGPLVMAWYPNESGADLKDARDAFGTLISDTLGRPVEHRTTTDYIIAIESVANNNAHLAWFGAEGYVQANERNSSVIPLVIPSGSNGSVESAVYYSWLAVPRGEEDQYRDGDGFSIENIQGKRFSFVSNSSTSGFRVPSSNIVTYFGEKPEWQNLETEDLLEGGPNNFFADVQFGGSHQGSAVNLITDRVDVAAFCDSCVDNYVSLVEGTENQVGAVYRVNDDADEPFNQFPGAEFVLIAAVPVLNAPFVANSSMLTAEEIQKLQAVLTSDEVANNDKIFATQAVIDAGFRPFFRKTDAERFLVVPDSFFDPIRAMR
ncbi:PhnD/SsuA/transferrin family substrate-binding protein [Candidatus Chloroploca sp. M-50]|uniref:PhnD/SsuA/transferrin family substrate-binding protein n=1 Tax=Candidatus Chloroploca mongolica TaxID=2528176 RepID=A0ABS4DGL7_9CHLR|nr:phosphate/phosphite/phosphonate ABC transporter substrate-binding protein [Candidatus Chloroploca mongolica]MBP1468586.1 PhnD/SsuA/transferrin family substrate-binding protein [Candidatus Chloroploca mongolica]